MNYKELIFFSDLVKNADMMCKQSLWTSVIAAHLASKHLKEGGALVLTGAEPCLKGTPGKHLLFLFTLYVISLSEYRPQGGGI